MGREEFIAQLVKRRGWRKGAELGLWYGRTYGHLLKTCEGLNLIGVDLFAPQPENEGPEDWAQWDHEGNEAKCREIAAAFPDRATLYKMKTQDAAEAVEDASLDFVFIDADHSSEGVRRDIEDWAPKVKPGGAVMGHDIDWPTVRVIVEELMPGYETGPDNVWYKFV